MNESQCAVCGKAIVMRGKKPGVFCSIECKAEWQRRQRPVDREWLYQKYITEKLSANAIAKLVKRDPKRVWEWLRESGIETRKRGYGGKPYFTLGMQSPFKGHKHTDEVKEQVRLRRLADGHVPYLKNGTHHLKGKRGAETPNWKGGITPERTAIYSTREWKDAVIAVWKRDDAICQLCGLDHRIIDKEEVQFAIHHIVSFADESQRCNPDNLVLLCRECHLFVHSNANVERKFVK